MWAPWQPAAAVAAGPGADPDAAARRVGDHVELRFTIPATNTDASMPPAITRLDIYAAVGPASPGPAPVIPIAVLTPPIASAKPISVLRFPALSLAVAPAASRKPALGPPTTAALLRRPEFLRGRIEVKPPPARAGRIRQECEDAGGPGAGTRAVRRPPTIVQPRETSRHSPTMSRRNAPARRWTVR